MNNTPQNQQRQQIIPPFDTGPVWPIRTRDGKPDKDLSCDIPGWNKVTRPIKKNRDEVREGYADHGAFVTRPACHWVVVIDMDNPAVVDLNFHDLVISRMPDTAPSLSAKMGIPGKEDHKHFYFRIDKQCPKWRAFLKSAPAAPLKLKNGIGEVLLKGLHICTDAKPYLNRDRLPELSFEDLQGLLTDTRGQNQGNHTPEPVKSPVLPEISDMAGYLKQYFQDEPFSGQGMKLQLGLLAAYGPDKALEIILDWKGADQSCHADQVYEKRIQAWQKRTPEDPVTFGTVRHLVNERARKNGDKAPFSKYQIIGQPNSETLGKWLDQEGIELCYEVHQRCYFYRIKGQGHLWERLTDRHRAQWRDQIKRTCGRQLSRNNVAPLSYGRDSFSDSMAGYTKDTANDERHFFIDWLHSEEVQGATPSLYDDLLIRYLDAPNEDYTRWATRALIDGILRRTFDPGCKMDYTVVLQGEEGQGKSAFFRNLLPAELEKQYSWFTDSVKLSMDGKELAHSLEGTLLCEFAELTGMNRTDQNFITQWLTSQTDQYRMSYGETKSIMPRRFVCTGTTNENKPLPAYKDHNRRFIVIPVDKKYELDDLKDRMQGEIAGIWKQALKDYENRRFHPAMPDHLSRLQKERNTEHRYNDPLLEERIENGIALIRAMDCNKLTTGFRVMDMDDSSLTHSKKVGQTLRDMGYEPCTYREGKRQIKGWAYKL